MWKAIRDMSEAELGQARQEMVNRLQSVAGHNKAARLEERKVAIEAEIERRSAGPFKQGERVKSRARQAIGVCTTDQHYVRRSDEDVVRVLWEGEEESEYDVPVVAIYRYDDGGDVDDQADDDEGPEIPLGRFVLEISPGNAAMLRGRDVAVALRDVAAKLDGEEFAYGWVGEGNVRDGNGNTVGRFTFDDHNGGAI